MRTLSSVAVVTLASLLGAACSDIGSGVGVDGGAGTAPGDAAVPGDGAPGTCTSGDLLIVLDRSGSMSQRPDGTMPPNTAQGALQTKWHAAVSTIDAVSAQVGDKIRFGLALFPEDPDGAGGRDCSNLSTWLNEYLPPETNDLACQPAEVLVSPALNAGPDINAAIDTDQTGLCGWTPTGAGLTAARSELASVAEPDRPQAILLITDGADTCDGRAGYSTLSLPAADQLAQDGVSIYVVGFDGSGEGIDPAELNDLACAGHTAPDFDQNCQSALGGGYRAVANPSPSRLFILAGDQAGLEDAVSQAAGDVCCDCPVEIL